MIDHQLQVYTSIYRLIQQYNLHKLLSLNNKSINYQIKL